MLNYLSGADVPAWVAASLLPGLLCIAAWALLLIIGRRRKTFSAGGAVTGCEAAAPPPLPPPLVPGLPVLGSALALGTGGAAFLQRCRVQASLLRKGVAYHGLAVIMSNLLRALQSRADQLCGLPHPLQALAAPATLALRSMATLSRCACWASA